MRPILATLAGILSGGVTVSIVESLGHLIWPPPPGTDLSNPEALAAIMDTIPTAALVAVLVAWIAGAFVGGWVAKKIDVGQGIRPSLVTGSVLMLFGVATMIYIPHPIWMWIFGIATPIPAALFGASLVKRTDT